LWEEASNYRKLLRSKTAVVNVSAKRRDSDHVKYGLERRAQANLRITYRNRTPDDIKTGEQLLPREKCEGNLLTVRAVSGAEEA